MSFAVTLLFFFYAMMTTSNFFFALMSQNPGRGLSGIIGFVFAYNLYKTKNYYKHPYISLSS